MSLEEFGQNATRVLTGEAGMDVLHEYFNILQLPGDLAWSSFFGLEMNVCQSQLWAWPTVGEDWFYPSRECRGPSFV